jgi:hypothetical protein
MRLRDRLFQPVDASSVVSFRIAFGVLMVIELTRYLAFGWVTDYWVDPTFHFKYFGFEWVRAWPGVGMYVHCIVLIAAAAMIAVGAFYRLAAAVFFLGFTYLFLIDQAQYLNHFYLICLFAALLMVVPAHRNASVDAWRRPDLRSDTLPAWTLWILRFQMGIVYFFGGVAKLNPDWLRGQPLTMWLQQNDRIASFFHSASVGLALSWGGMLFDLLIVPALLWRRTRVPAFAVLVLFHLTNAYLFSIGIFPWLCIAASLLFFPADWTPFQRLIGRVRLKPTGPGPDPGSRRLVVGFLAVWVAVQLLVPLRHVLYRGNVHWTEEGHRFAWHMKLRSKDTTGALFIVVEETGERIRVRALDHLTVRQIAKMRSRPDMLLQYAHFLADEYTGRGEVAVHAHIFAGLNGRPVTRFIDPDVDLSEEPRTLRRVEWVLPLDGRNPINRTDSR